MNLDQAMKVLNLSEEFTEVQLKASFHKLSKENHPDLNGNEARQKEINSAYDVLKEYLKDRQSKEEKNYMN